MDYTAAALLLCNVHRNTFSVLLPQISSALQLSPSQAGQIQAANLLAYLVGQLPAGTAADKLGGTRCDLCTQQSLYSNTCQQWLPQHPDLIRGDCLVCWGESLSASRALTHKALLLAVCTAVCW
eukprot:GHUV01054187.1.p1 GENE.GHUV01054187.1~~GHUV01054187.1.p1  ORF type:complete len:124 (+),score=22.03 GHUV01054187.1:95-466(+)